MEIIHEHQQIVIYEGKRGCGGFTLLRGSNETSIAEKWSHFFCQNFGIFFRFPRLGSSGNVKDE